MIQENDLLQDALDKFVQEKEAFDTEGQILRARGEQDEKESEKIGYFKANKPRLEEELKQLAVELEKEKNQIRDEKIELEIFKTELKTKQKTIESMRFNYIKNDQENMVHKAELISNAKGGAFTPLKPPQAF